MKRLLALSLGMATTVALAALGAARPCSAQSEPQVHKQPITLRVVDGGSGKPMPFARLRVVAGYDPHDLKIELWQEEAVTDKDGKVLLPEGIRQLPWFQLRVEKAPLCLDKNSTFSMERVRNFGLASANHCGTATAEEQPGEFVLFVKGNQHDPQSAEKSSEKGADDPDPSAGTEGGN